MLLFDAPTDLEPNGVFLLDGAWIIRDGRLQRTTPTFLFNMIGNTELATPFGFTITRPSGKALELYLPTDAVRAAWTLSLLHHCCHAPHLTTALPLPLCPTGA